MRWPDTPVHEVPEPTVTAALAALDGYDQAAVVAADAPDLPGLTLGKLLRPLTSRPVAVARVAEALVWLARRGLLYVDFREPNVRVDDDGHGGSGGAGAPRIALR